VIKFTPTVIAVGYVLLARPSDSVFYILLAIALVFCALGDVMMEKDLVPGIGMFLIAHLFFTGSFLLQSGITGITPDALGFFGVFVGLMVMYVFVFIRYLRSSGPEIPDFILKAGTLYFVLIGVTLSSAVLLWLTTGVAQGLFPVIGALFFVISDSLIAIREFHHEISNDELLVMPTYYLAIYLLSLSVIVYIL
jgi:uncharacterized membrane protein YhhN